MGIIEECYVINWDGIPIFRYSADRNSQSVILGSLFSAIQSFAQKIEDGENSFVRN